MITYYKTPIINKFVIYLFISNINISLYICTITRFTLKSLFCINYESLHIIMDYFSIIISLLQKTM